MIYNSDYCLSKEAMQSVLATTQCRDAFCGAARQERIDMCSVRSRGIDGRESRCFRKSIPDNTIVHARNARARYDNGRLAGN